jgi:hypothetical protein
MHMHGTALVEVRLIDENDLRALATGRLEPRIAEAVEAYLLHHPYAASRVETYRRELQRPQRAQLRVM